MDCCFFETDEKLIKGASLLGEELGIRFTGDGTKIKAVKGIVASIMREEGTVIITYSKECEFYRALSMLNGFLDSESYKANLSARKFDMLCFMADMSRNAVYNIESAKRMIRLLSLMGYDSMMLYTEDTFEMKEFPYFGYMRGRFSEEELKELDSYADVFGIELIPCIQSLGHLAAALKWNAMSYLRDTSDIILAESERSYDFIEKMIITCKRCFRSEKINLGMDEAYSLGLGRYLSLNGYKKSSDIMASHLEKVVSLCEKHGYKPMIWSDMFFNMQFGKYWVKEGHISEEIKSKVPKGLTLIYWDYYSLDREMFSNMIDNHLRFDNPTVFAGGAWKWSGFAPHNRFSLLSTKMQLDCCEEQGLKNVIVTAWGDNGAEASQFSVLPTMLYFAERVYSSEAGIELMEQRSRECFGTGYEELLTLDAPNELPGISLTEGYPKNPCKYLFYNDPVTGLFNSHFDRATAKKAFAENAKKLSALKSNKRFGYIFDSESALCEYLAASCDLNIRIREAYESKDKEALRIIAEKDIPDCLRLIGIFSEKFRRQWDIENKGFGFDIQDLRIGGMKERLSHCAALLNAYLKGEISKIDELEEEVRYFDCRPEESETNKYLSYNWFSRNFSASVF